MNFLDFLLQNKIIDEKQATSLKDESIKAGLSFEDLILKKNIIQESDLFKAKAKYLDIPLKEKIPEDVPDDVLSLLPRESVDFYRMVPLSLNRQEGILEVGMVSPDDAQAKQALQFLSRQYKFTVKVFLITVSAFRGFLKKYRKSEQEVESALKDLQKDEVSSKEGAEQASFTRLVEDAPVIKMVAVILRQAVEGGASDIHIEPQRQTSRVRYRFDGILYSSLELPFRIHAAVIARIKILSGLKIDETRLPQDGRFSTMISNQKVDFRVASFPTTLGEKIVLRILKTDQSLQTLESLGFSGRNLTVTEKVAKKQHGMMLVTGPTGSGKSTTLYGLLNLLNKEGINIVTLEDPVEYSMDGISQSQANPDIGYTFAKGLRQILRQDPDIIMVGEIRDEETANLAVHAALTGHLVLSTLHTNSAIGAVPRLVDMGIKPFLLAPSLSLVIGQRLVRKLCSFCKEKVKPSGAEKTYLQEQIRLFPEDLKREYLGKAIDIFKPAGCKKCNNKGYKGRVGVFEVLEITNTLAEAINKDLNEQSLQKEVKLQNMITLQQDSILKVLEGVTSLEEVAGTLQAI